MPHIAGDEGYPRIKQLEKHEAREKQVKQNKQNALNLDLQLQSKVALKKDL